MKRLFKKEFYGKLCKKITDRFKAVDFKNFFSVGRLKSLFSRPKLVIVIAFVWFFVFILTLLFYPFYNVETVVYIPPGTGSAHIGKILCDEGVVRSELLFNVAGRVFNMFSRIKSGEYEFKGRVSTWGVLRKLTKWQIKLYKVTVPEGYTIEEIALLLSGKGLVNYNRFVDMAGSSSFKIDSYFFPSNLEGYLLPDTYYFARASNTEEFIIGRMLTQFKKRVIDVYTDQVPAGYTLNDVITIASIVEKEAMTGRERPIIAKVFYNRLRRGMLLQSCSTVMYALNKKNGRLSLKDLTVPSRFNTYLNPGVPPHPICSPGIASIKAVFNPADTDYLYFVSKNDGTHHFTTNFEEHKKAKIKYQGG